MSRDNRPDASLLPISVEQMIVDRILNGELSQDDGLAYRLRVLNEYDKNGNLVIDEGDQYGVEYNGAVLPQKFESFEEARAWAMWNYKGSRRGWRVIARKK